MPRPNSRWATPGAERAYCINTALMSDCTVEEIAAAENISVANFWKLRERWGFSVGKSSADSMRRRVSTLIGLRLFTALDLLAADMGTDRAGALADLLKLVLAQDAFRARQLLKVTRRATDSEVAA